MDGIGSIDDLESDSDDEESEDDYEEMEEEAIFLHQNLTNGVLNLCPNERSSYLIDQRIRWDEYVVRYGMTGFFKRHLRMSLNSFNTLLNLIRQQLEIQEHKSQGHPITPEIQLFCTLRYLSGASYLDLKLVTGLSVASLYRAIWKTCEAITKVPSLSIKFPKTREECADLAAGFASKSPACGENGEERAINNCVGVVDGYLLRINAPSRQEVNNVKTYFSGHYQCYGINVQAVADHLCRFTYFAVVAPGVTGDSEALKCCDLAELINQLPIDYCIIGDAAYPPVDQLVPLFYGVDRQIKAHDDFNYFASSLRMRIEMAFGRMQSKWGILHRPLQISMTNIPILMMAIARLHNFVINEEDPDIFNNDDTLGLRYHFLPTEPENDDGELLLRSQMNRLFTGWSELRSSMVRIIQRFGLTRPGRV